MLWTNDFHLTKESTPYTDSTTGQTLYRTTYTATQSYIILINDFKRPRLHSRQFLPPDAAHLPLAVTGISVSPYSDRHFKVTITATAPDDSIEDANGNDVSSEFSMPDRSENHRTTTRSQVTHEPILSYYKLRNTNGTWKYPIADIITLATYLNGGLIPTANSLYRYSGEPADTPGHISLPNLPITKYITHGYKSYTRDAAIITHTYTTSHPPIDKIPNVGKITQLPNAPTSIDGYTINYLFSRLAISKNAPHSYDITEEYTTSAPGGWNTSIYQSI